jgi:hypothetical protein
MTDDPERAVLGMSTEQRRWRAERVRQDLEGKSDLELIGEVAGQFAPHVINPMELNRRLRESIKDLAAEVKAARASSDKLGSRLIWLTRLLVILTLVLVCLTVVLAIRAL